MMKQVIEYTTAAKRHRPTTEWIKKLRKSLIEIALIAASLFLLTQASIVKSRHAGTHPSQTSNPSHVTVASTAKHPA